jgi:hypothetical protein
LSGRKRDSIAGEDIDDAEPSASQGGHPATIVGSDDPLAAWEPWEWATQSPSILDHVRPCLPVALGIAG